MKANITKRLACTLLALAVMITTVFVHVESAQAAERLPMHITLQIMRLHMQEQR